MTILKDLTATNPLDAANKRIAELEAALAKASTSETVKWVGGFNANDTLTVVGDNGFKHDLCKPIKQALLTHAPVTVGQLYSEAWQTSVGLTEAQRRAIDARFVVYRVALKNPSLQINGRGMGATFAAAAAADAAAAAQAAKEAAQQAEAETMAKVQAETQKALSEASKASKR